MYKDFSQDPEIIFKTDVCIIGAGAAGFTAAVSLLKSGLKVLVLEGGTKCYDSRAADLQRGEVVAQPHTGIHEARERIVGGTTTKWGGQALPFMPEDFVKRNHVKLSGWPISQEDLLPYYHKAESILGTDVTVPFGYRPWKDWHIEEPGFTRTKVDLFVTKWCKMPNFAMLHGEKIENSATVHLLRNANVVELIPSLLKDSVASIKIKSLDGKEGTVMARYIIAAGGALETVRLLLNSTQFGKKGLGNQSGLVGSFFQDHVSARVGQIFPSSRKNIHAVFDPFYKNGFKYFPRIKLMPGYAEKLGILHASAQIVFSEEDTGVLNYAKTIFSNLKKKQLSASDLKPLANPTTVMNMAKAVIRWKIRKRGTSSNGPILLEIHSEQEPNAESCIQLSKMKDALGMYRIRLHWQISDLTIETIRRAAQLIKEEFEKAGIGTVKLAPWLTHSSDEARLFLTDVYHQAGGLRMSEKEEEGVVDSSCRVFGIDNLYIASSAVFPTSSFSNPTMTTIALAVRICEEVESRFKKVL
jgi:choline dehydrogenase-like flavoprotein